MALMQGMHYITAITGKIERMAELRIPKIHKSRRAYIKTNLTPLTVEPWTKTEEA
jgi:hypothetical protein